MGLKRRGEENNGMTGIRRSWGERRWRRRSRTRRRRRRRLPMTAM